MIPRIHTVAIGDELLNGTQSDTHTTYVSKLLFQEGIPLSAAKVIPDSLDVIVETLRKRSETCDFVCCFGGLGPTSDDKTVKAAALICGGGVVEHQPSKKRLIEHYQKHNRQVSEEALKQVFYPRNSEPILNEVGLAPGFTFQFGRCCYYFLPGVPGEMKAMFERSVLPKILERADKDSRRERLLSHLWKCMDVTESHLQAILGKIEKELGDKGWIGYRACYPENHVRLYFKAQGPSALERFEGAQQEIRELLAPWCFMEGERELEQEVVEGLRLRNERIVLVESCTGGMVTQRLVSVPGASDVVWGGVVTYQRDAKRALLGIELDHEHEEVSKKCTQRLAQKALEMSSCTLAVAVTGYLGPSGGTQNDPLGTVFICIKGNQQNDTLEQIDLEQKIILKNVGRAQNQYNASTLVLRATLRTLKKEV